MNNSVNQKDSPIVFDIMKSFGSVPIENTIPKGYKKLVLTKLRWVLIDFGLSHYLLPDMQLMEYIIISSSLEEWISSENLLDLTTYYRILAARNILKLLGQSYNYYEEIKMFYDVKFEDFLSALGLNNSLITTFNTNRLLNSLNLSKFDSIKRITDVLLARIEPIIILFKHKNNICAKLTDGTSEEREILDAFELFQFVFPICFSFEISSLFSKEYLNAKYKTTRIETDYDNMFITSIRERGNKYED